VTPEPEQLDSDYKLRYTAYYIISKLELLNKMNELLHEALMRSIIPCEVDLDAGSICQQASAICYGCLRMCFAI
jgi:hypothetical protein